MLFTPTYSNTLDVASGLGDRESHKRLRERVWGWGRESGEVGCQLSGRISDIR